MLDVAGQQAAATRVAEAAALMAYLRGPKGCPWDREQTFDSIKRNTLEETYEVFDAIERRAWPELCDELGDLLLQVLFYSQMAAEAGYFSLADVAEGLSSKLVRRHPHIFGDGSGTRVLAADAQAVEKTWDRVKREERQTKARADVPRTGLLEQVPRAMPAMIEAAKLGSRAARVGFDWPDAQGIVDKLVEETGELKAALSEGAGGMPPIGGEVEEELGDLLFTAVNLARRLKLDPESALRRSNAKFRARFGSMEAKAGGSEALGKIDAAGLEELWAEAKETLAQREGGA